MNRRQFVKSSLATAATLAVVPKEAWGAPGAAAEPTRAVMRKVAQYQLTHPDVLRKLERGHPNGWIVSSLHVGIVAAGAATGDAFYLDAATKWAEDNRWEPGPRPRHADDLCCGQVYLGLAKLRPDRSRAKPIRSRVDAFLKAPKPGKEDWWWSDALFMAPPVFAQLSDLTGDPRYVDALPERFFDAVGNLTDPATGLLYRDRRFVGRVTGFGKKVLWARGNGWVVAGLARILAALPKDHPSWPRFADLLVKLCGAAAPLQQEDGFWRTSLLDADDFPTPESSATGMFCYGMLWGMKAGLLPRSTFQPVATAAWKALCGAVSEEGRLGWVQPPGHRPVDTYLDDTFAYGAGAFLLAGSVLATT